MSTSKLLFSTTSLFLKTTHHKPLISSLSPPSFLFSKPLHFRRFSFVATAVSSATLEPHPWPEWVSFVDKLKSKGYFTDEVLNKDGEENEGLYKDIHLLKDPCLTFARDRFDVFKSLSLPEIQAVVESGCSNILRKTVNSSKRLRAFARLDEGDVCAACNLRGSCDRAYALLQGNEANARTLDIVRVLLAHALDPLAISGGEKLPGRGIVEAAARKLLSELIELSETDIDPSLPVPAATFKKVDSSEKQNRTVNYDKMSENVEMKRGDWMCPKCNFLNFSRNIRCFKCREAGPIRVGADDIEIKKGDWICSECNFMNFSKNIRCLKCQAEGPKRVSQNNTERKKGDWNCSECGFMNFASKTKCFRCQVPRPLKPGDWLCPSCDFLNYRGNTSCRKCNCECPTPKETISDHEEQIWRRPNLKI